MPAPRVPHGADLQQLMYAGSRSADSETRRTLKRPPRSLSVSSYADMGESIVVDTTAGDVDVKLRPVSPEHDGEWLVITHMRGGGTCRIVAPGGTTINGSLLSMSLSVGSMVDVYAFGDRWITDRRSTALPSSTADEPFWEWNGTDTTQFDTVVRGANCPSAALSVVSLAGRNWVKFSVVSNTNVINMFPRCAVAPITVTPPSADYRITYDYACSAFDTGNLLVQGVVARWTTGTYTGNYYSGFVDNSGGMVRCSLVANGINSAPNFREEARQVVYSSTADMHSGEFSVRDDSLLWADMLSTEVGFIESAGTYSAAGQPGLIAGTDNVAATRTIEALYSNIKCWEIT